MKHNREQLDPPKPPPPPPFSRKLELGWLQLAGVGALLLLPVLALTGALGIADGQASARGGDLQLELRYPQRTRYKTPNAIELRLSNQGGHALEQVKVRLAEDYLAHFGELQFHPPAASLTAQGAEIELGALPPGQTRRILVELRAEERGRHPGRISAFAAGATPLEVEFSTLVLP